MGEQVNDNVARDRLLTTLSSAFGVLATLLAGLGLYGVLAYAVAQRGREIGIRMALGATIGRIRTLVVKQVLPMVLIGCGAGLVGAIGLGRFVRSLLFGVEPGNPTLFASVVALILVVAAAAASVPARRAARIDPVVALRTE